MNKDVKKKNKIAQTVKEQRDGWTRKQKRRQPTFETINSFLFVTSLFPLRPQYACMPVRKMVTGTRVCRSEADCAAHSNAPSVCVTPSLENQTRFIRVTHPPNTHMLFVGYPPHLQYSGTYGMSRFCVRIGV